MLAVVPFLSRMIDYFLGEMAFPACCGVFVAVLNCFGSSRADRDYADLEEQRLESFLDESVEDAAPVPPREGRL